MVEHSEGVGFSLGLGTLECQGFGRVCPFWLLDPMEIDEFRGSVQGLAVVSL